MKMLLVDFGDGKSRTGNQRAVFESLNGFESFEGDWRIEGFDWNGVDGGPAGFVGGGVGIGFGGDFEEAMDGALTYVVIKECDVARLHSAYVAGGLGIADALQAEAVAREHVVPSLVLVGAADQPVLDGGVAHGSVLREYSPWMTSQWPPSGLPVASFFGSHAFETT